MWYIFQVSVALFLMFFIMLFQISYSAAEEIFADPVVADNNDGNWGPPNEANAVADAEAVGSETNIGVPTNNNQFGSAQHGFGTPRNYFLNFLSV